jgi:ABC-type uncharacterized transport system auxiliary subunit
MTRTNRLLPGTLLVLLAGCGGTFQSHDVAPDVYVLRGRALPPAPRPIDATLVIARPTARPGLDGERIAVTLPDHRIDGYAHGRWGAELPRIVQGLLLDAFRGAAGFHSVVADQGAFSGRYLLEVEVQEFAADYADRGSVPVVHVTLRGQLGVLGNRVPIADVTGSATVPAGADRQRDVAAAFEAAAAEATAQLVAAVDAAAAADRAAHP